VLPLPAPPHFWRARLKNKTNVNFNETDIKLRQPKELLLKAKDQYG
jgi:hypothetical protein